MMMDNISHRWSLNNKENKLKIITVHIEISNKGYKDCRIARINKQPHCQKVIMVTLNNI